eukprot:Pompholyxophrys_punicea_v1_NODE_7_length_8407_cov_7.217433.p3 type:complete len:104 gc:universal NODE_7_length_8407_cov_7.217433:8165-7854(-)
MPSNHLRSKVAKNEQRVCAQGALLRRLVLWKNTQLQNMHFDVDLKDHNSLLMFASFLNLLSSHQQFRVVRQVKIIDKLPFVLGDQFDHGFEFLQSFLLKEKFG